MSRDPGAVRRRWAERTGEFSPTYYAHRGPDRASEAVLSVLDRFLDRGAPVLEVGCSSGRHLAALHRAGFTDLWGVDPNVDAVAVMADRFPAVADAATVRTAAIEDVVGEFGDGRFDAVFSVETLQHIHPESDWVFAELARITGTVLVTVENERGVDADRSDGAVTDVREGLPLYHRDWGRVFGDLGMTEVAVDAEGRDRTVVRAFRPADRARGPAA